MNKNLITVKSLLAGNGDSFIVSFFDVDGNPRNILIDGGHNKGIFKKNLKAEFLSIQKAEENIDLLIVTHIDSDHIKGVIYLFEEFGDTNSDLKEETVLKYWFNANRPERVINLSEKQFDVSIAEMHALEKHIHAIPAHKWDISKKIAYPMEIGFHGARMSILSPNLEVLNKFIEHVENFDISRTSDYENSFKSLISNEKIVLENNLEELDDKLTNASSIAFLFEYCERSILFLGDAIPEVIDKSIRELLKERGLSRLKVDIVKLSHHGSRKSISNEFLDLVDCSSYIISTNGAKANLPNKSTIAKIVSHPNRPSTVIDFHFNYPDFSKTMEITQEDKINYNFATYSGNYEHGHLLTLIPHDLGYN